jgi:CRISPR type III-B/RAMP module-associated protein Cmr3
MDFEGLKRYLGGGVPEPEKIEVNGQELRKPYLKEIRSGIRLKAQTKITEEGALYTAEFLRVLNGWRFVVWYESIQDIPSGLIKLGGEGRGVVCENIEEIDIDEKLNFSKLVEKINEDNVFKLYIATPSYFGGCLPPKDRLEKILGVDLNLIAAVPGKPVYIGGYDFAINKEKPLRRWVNAGAVYYYKFDGKIKDDLELPIKIIDENIDMRCAFIGIGGDKNV